VPRPVLLAIDGNSLVHRAFHAQGGIGHRSASGTAIWAVRGLLSQLVAGVERVDADAVIVGFDDPAASLRRQQWPQYKATRVDKPQVLIDQLELAVAVLTELGVAVVRPTGLEADDVLCSAASWATRCGADTVIMTSDRDSFALIDTNTRVLRILNGGVEASPLLTPERLTMMLGIRPEQYRDFAALRGDPSDNLPGVSGIGPKTAARLLAAMGTARAAFDDAAGDGAEVTAAIGAAMAAKLADPQSRDRWELNCQVMRMHGDLTLGIDLTAGPGVLPLAEHAVRRIFAEHQLSGTAANAVRVLARCEQPDAEVRYASAPSGGRHVDDDRLIFSTGRPARFARLQRDLKPKVDQLALF
jgi:5'-3' exonuclease